ncbi:MAG: hypothetical protein NVSMB64_28240 [Candidatus Velthaea sp.]
MPLLKNVVTAGPYGAQMEDNDFAVATNSAVLLRGNFTIEIRHRVQVRIEPGEKSAGKLGCIRLGIRRDK